MTYLFKLARRTACRRALPLIALTASIAACNADQLAPNSDQPEVISLSEPAPVATSTAAPSFSSSFRDGMPFGTFAQPNEAFDNVLNGAMRNIAPELLVRYLADIKARGGRVILMMVGNERYYKDAQGHFSFSLWKERVNRFRGVNFNSYITDGTVIGHYLIDEPNDPYNWHGEPIPGSMIEEMAKYSKSLWPNMLTIVRAHPTYMDNFSTTYKYLDAAWAQYAERFGDPKAYLAANVAAAKSKGLGLVVGMNISMGTLKKTEISAQQIDSWGSALLSDSYPCAFINWQYREPYMSRSDIRGALARVAAKAATHPARSCGDGRDAPPPPPDDNPPPDDGNPPPPPDDNPEPPSLPGGKGMTLTATRVLRSGDQMIALKWTGLSGARVDLYRNGVLRRVTPNDGSAYSAPKRTGVHSYKVCLRGTSKCSNAASARIR